MIIKTEGDPRPYSFHELRRDNPNTSFPRDPDTSLFERWGCAVADEVVPQMDDVTQEKVIDRIERKGSRWVVNYKAQLRGNAADRARARRNKLLAETDRYALQDVEMTQAMRDYRQALRDIPQQAGFPGNIDWPEKP